MTFCLKGCVDDLPETGIQIADFKTMGDGSKSHAWIQLLGAIFGVPFVRPWSKLVDLTAAAIDMFKLFL